jgi:hypothetical protein
MRLIGSACRARTATGHAAAPLNSTMKSRRFTARAFRSSDRKDSTPQRAGRVLRCGISIRLTSVVGQKRPYGHVGYNVRFAREQTWRGDL